MTDPRETRPKATPPSEAACQALVERLYPGVRLRSVQRLTGGVSADVYRLQLALHHELTEQQPHSLVLRLHGATHAGHPAPVEFALVRALHQTGLPVPEALLADETDALFGAPYVVMCFMPGSSTIAAHSLAARIRTMARTLADIHETSTTELPALPQRLEPLPEAFDYWPHGSDWQQFRAQLQERQIPAYNEPPRLLHGDFWPENLLWQDGEISAVLDWEDAALGDPLADVAAAGVELRYLFGKNAMAQFKAAYASHRCIDPLRLAGWQLFTAAAAQKFMGSWGLPAERVAHMHTEALASIREASEVVLQLSS